MSIIDFSTKEHFCESAFRELGECFHLWTPENFEIIFTCEEDFKAGMSIMGICAKLFPDVTILTFELMSNHLHITAAGKLARLLAMFETIKEMLKRMFKSKGRTIDWEKFVAGYRRLETLTDARNVIVYNNRNGYAVRPDCTPFTYPWGANRYYFNPDACKLATNCSSPVHIREIRIISHARFADGVKGLLKYEGYVLPLSFCDIRAGERLFRDPAHYFSKISRSIEADAKIAKEIGESIFYTDDDLYSAVCRICREGYSTKFSEASGQNAKQFRSGITPAQLPAQAKLEVARTMRFEYNASDKQIQRILKLDQQTVTSLFGHK